MTCPTPERLAAAASGEDDAVVAHAAECIRCRATLDEQREMRGIASRTPMIVLSRSQREELAAEVMARIERAPRGGRSRLWIGAALAAAGLVLAIFATRGGTQIATPRFDGTDDDWHPTLRSTSATRESAVDKAPEVATKAHVDGAAELSRDSRGDRDVVHLASGELSVDARGTLPVQIVTGDTTVGVRGAKVAIIAKHGVIASVHVFAGSAELTVAGRRRVIEAGIVWERDGERDASLAAFRTGWQALRDKRIAEAIAAFDRATHPVVAEDAAYWAAIASERADDRVDARRRYVDFLARFPMSPRAVDVQAALARLGP